jgi:aldehyde dehydrogenase (NAD+)
MAIVDATTSETGAAALVSRLRESFRSGLTRPLVWRRTQLVALRRMLVEREADLTGALAFDLGKPAVESWITELRHVTNEIDHILAHLGAWSAPDKVPVRALLQPAKATIVPEPLGVALVIAPWNYPVHLLALPLAYALAAGNAVVAKPSELAPHTAAAIAKWIPQYLDESAVAIVEGGAPVVTELLEQRWDHIFYTGNGRVGRIVMAAAARNLTPVTLELGGKSPAIVAADADIEVAARRIAWGKFVNAGQTCVAPDYVLVDRSIEAELVDRLVDAVDGMFGTDAARSGNYARILNERHFDRLQGLLQSSGATIAIGGDSDRAARYIAPTVLTGVSWDAPVMGEEIFGPILPVIAVDGMDEAIRMVNDHDKPLALYVFSADRQVIESVVAETSSGGVCANATLVQLAVTDLPFGGVGASGMGAYHGQAGFDTFSHRKAVLVTTTKPDLPLLYPPYTRMKQWVLRKVL